ncbi:MAG TPA: 4Fe-4S binding protein [Dehalococcoidia bacterium]|nr:4Fe-4S binding protein [Dehalococcoidia bacterium]
MKIDPELCIACEACIEYCPMGAISMGDDVAAINQDECVECGICLRSWSCSVDAFIDEKHPWPRQIRAEFSNPTVPHH